MAPVDPARLAEVEQLVKEENDRRAAERAAAAGQDPDTSAAAAAAGHDRDEDAEPAAAGVAAKEATSLRGSVAPVGLSQHIGSR